ncbi:O-methylsterigmatocystin oxidoreductase [Ilyonectria sp. MPI-CAGE-AT-0026]|nr:O-methylsterigmatocystin oxidoreductase [Ilyonectria sp. MPI-CAGE-AT-0026]
MASPISQLQACGLLVAVLLVVFYQSTRVRVPKGLRLPPGPVAWPLVGHTFQLPKHPQEKIREWAKEYGEIWQINLVNKRFVMLCTPEAVKEVIDKNSAIASSRIRLPAQSEVVSGGLRTLLMEYGPRWRALRAIIHKLTTPKVSDSMRPSQDFEAKQLVYDILTDNQNQENFYVHCRRYTTSVVMTSTYGKRIATWDNPNIKQVYQIMKELSDTAPGKGFLVDTLPFLADIPLWMQTWRKKALEYFDRQQVLWTRLYEELKDDMEKGVAPDCFVKQLCETDFEKQNITPLQAAFVSGSMIEAGSETTASALNTCLKYLAAYPRVQQVANEELTRVVGEDCSPDFRDFDDLKYIRAIGKEILRIRPAGSLGIPHLTTGDIVYKDFFIPKGSCVTICQYVVHFGSNFENPEEFYPDRYMANCKRAGEAVSFADPSQRDHFGFGSGRRICPGLHIAENSLFVTLAKILWAFEIKAPLDANGREEPLDLSFDAFEDGVIVVPKPFKLRFVPRSKHREQVVRSEWDSAKREGFYLGDIKVNENGMLTNVAHGKEGGH